ncbi:Lipase 3, partial [Gryllus bimaculatus]
YGAKFHHFAVACLLELLSHNAKDLAGNSKVLTSYRDSLRQSQLSASRKWIIRQLMRGVCKRLEIALMLADNGYDVWLTNSRGNDYSKKHENMTRRDPRFWMFSLIHGNTDISCKMFGALKTENFPQRKCNKIILLETHDNKFVEGSWHEMGVYDIPACIDYILNATRQEKLFYVGHSMGNSVFFVALGLRPEYNAKIRLQLSFGPSAFFHGAASAPLRIVTANADYIKVALNLFPTYELLPKTDAFIALNYEYCSDDSYFSKMCAVFFSWGVGALDLNNTTQLARQLARGISSTSALVPWHYTQILR